MAHNALAKDPPIMGTLVYESEMSRGAGLMVVASGRIHVGDEIWLLAL